MLKNYSDLGIEHISLGCTRNRLGRYLARESRDMEDDRNVLPDNCSGRYTDVYTQQNKCSRTLTRGAFCGM